MRYVIYLNRRINTLKHFGTVLQNNDTSFMNIFMKVDNTECIGNKENWNSSGKEMIALGQHVMGYDDIVPKIKQDRGGMG